MTASPDVGSRPRSRSTSSSQAVPRSAARGREFDGRAGDDARVGPGLKRARRGVARTGNQLAAPPRPSDHRVRVDCLGPRHPVPRRRASSGRAPTVSNRSTTPCQPRDIEPLRSVGTSGSSTTVGGHPDWSSRGGEPTTAGRPMSPPSEKRRSWSPGIRRLTCTPYETTAGPDRQAGRAARTADGSWGEPLQSLPVTVRASDPTAEAARRDKAKNRQPSGPSVTCWTRLNETRIDTDDGDFCPSSAQHPRFGTRPLTALIPLRMAKLAYICSAYASRN